VDSILSNEAYFRERLNPQPDLLIAINWLRTEIDTNKVMQFL
jgi:hypothetical protein